VGTLLAGSRLPRHLAPLAGVVCVLAACTDGYPTEDAPHMDPAQMTQAQLLQAMNQLGSEKHLGARWRYALADGCRLDIQVRNGAPEARSVPLEGAEIEVDTEDKVFHIFVLPAGGADAAPVPALQSRQWVDSVRMQSLLAYLERSCSAAPAAAPR
jgi:hypothetical protein